MSSSDDECEEHLARQAGVYSQYHEKGIDYIVQACKISGGQLAVYFLLLFVFMLFPLTRKVLAPRRAADENTREAVWHWLYEALGGRDIEDGDIRIDGQIIIRFCDMGLKFSILGSLIGGVLVILYGTAEGDSPDFLRYAVNNLKADEFGRGYVVVIAAWLQAGVFYLLVRQEWHHFVGLRRRHLLRRAQGKEGPSAAQAQYSVMVENVPRALQTEAAVRQRFAKVFGPEHIHSCILQEDTAEKWHLYALNALDQGGQKKACGRLCCSCCSSFSSYGPKGIVKLERSTVNLLRHLTGASTSTAFVTLTDARDCTTADQIAIFGARQHALAIEFDDWVMLPAPENIDIIWENASQPKSIVDQRHKLGLLICLIGVLFWAVPIVAIQGLALLPYEEYVPTLVTFLQEIKLYNFIAGYLPALVLMLLLSVLPTILSILSERFEGQKIRTEIQRQVLRRNLCFQLATIYITVLATGIITTVTLVLKRPHCFAKILGKSVPAVSPYFATFVIIKCGTYLPCLLLWPMVQLLTRPVQVHRTLRNKLSDSDLVVKASLAFEATGVALVLMLALTYSVIAPLMLPVCAVYFALAAFTYRWLFRNVYTLELDCTGMMWVDLYHAAMVGLLLSTMSLAGFFAFQDLDTDTAGLHVNEDMGHWLLSWIPLIVLAVVILHRQYRQSKYYWPLYRAMPLEDAAKVDRDTTTLGSKERVNTFDTDYYKDWILRFLEDQEGGSTALGGVGLVSVSEKSESLVDEAYGSHAVGLGGILPTLVGRGRADAIPTAGAATPVARCCWWRDFPRLFRLLFRSIWPSSLELSCFSLEQQNALPMREVPRQRRSEQDWPN